MGASTTAVDEARHHAGIGQRASGGKTVHAARLGILMLETRFPRIPGDVGNALTWPFPVLYRTVGGAVPSRVVKAGADGLLDAFLDGAAELIESGADGITTSCGFLSLFQNELAAHCAVPVATSSLMQVPLVERLLPPDRRVGIIAVSAPDLTAEHLLAAGVAVDTPLVGTEGGEELTRVLVGNETELDPAAAERDVLAAGEELLRAHPEVGAVVLECTNMMPYSAALRRRLGVPVYDMYSFATWFYYGLEPRSFPAARSASF